MSSKEPVEVSLSERVRNSYKELDVAAKELDGASNELKEAVSVLDAALKRLKLGVTAWVTLGSNDDDDGTGEWWDRRLGYTKVGKEWRIALSYRRGHYQFPDDDDVEEWAFDDAPRWMRVDAVKKFPELLDALVKQAREMSGRLKKRAAQALELGEAMAKALDGAESEQKKAVDNA